MGYEQIGKLIDRWLNDQNFRTNFRKDPEGTLQKSGVRLNGEELAALRKIDWGRPDEELKSQISKGL